MVGDGYLGDANAHDVDVEGLGGSDGQRRARDEREG